jgi:heparan-alpha-glucosaminide N-acetyltransferase
MINKLTTQRILSIDVFRGITILVMIFVNEVSGVSGIPSWMKHVKANEDAMTFVDVVFPAFLFIVGMSIPFAVSNRLAKGDSMLKLIGHILWRSLGLIVLGLFMMNSEDDYHNTVMGISMPAWALLFYICAILVWNVYTFKQKHLHLLFKGIGVAGLIILAIIYRGRKDGMHHMEIGWWGILGLIGWAYLLASMIYLLLKGNMTGLLVAIGICLIYYIASQTPALHTAALHPFFSQAKHTEHASIVLCGIVLSLIFFNQLKDTSISQRFVYAGIFTITLFLLAFMLRPLFKISKIYATPSWCFYSAGICCIIFSGLYWLVDLKHHSNWTTFLRPAAANSLLVYLLPPIIYALMGLFNINLPDVLGSGLPGVIWCAFYAVALVYVVKGLNKLKIKLQL